MALLDGRLGAEPDQAAQWRRGGIQYLTGRREIAEPYPLVCLVDEKGKSRIHLNPGHGGGSRAGREVGLLRMGASAGGREGGQQLLLLPVVSTSSTFLISIVMRDPSVDLDWSM
ncbi:hypothetical protein [Nonomuraea helvata]|uniref:Uncharacterized protein n=1 Tax=Nonomuraea helvata TaxID=37484 RepID=A0ABV5S2K9_9ACTN